MSFFIAFSTDGGDWFERLDPPAGARKETVPNLHLTLAFLGRIPEDLARAAFERVRAWPPFTWAGTVGPIIPLGPPHKPSVLAATIADNRAPLAAFMTAHRDELTDAVGAPREQKPALPHVTVARFHWKTTPAERAAGVAWGRATDLHAPPISLGELALYGPAPEPRVPRYRIFARTAAPLGVRAGSL
ncbi:MAG: hypothetical protein KIT84_30145 [Labilithrix sp.]|nr:hypothetical protein [Labilithrix sp.]MCW5815326.1 hypothetical protein [Labilithrix sp.]